MELYLFKRKLQVRNINVEANNFENLNDSIIVKNGIEEMRKFCLGNFSNTKFPILFYVHSGKKLCDIIGTGSLSLILISKKVKDLLEINECTGVSFFEIKLIDRDKKEIKGYYGLSILGKFEYPDWRKSEIIQKQHKSKNSPLVNYYKGMHFNLKSWTKTDFSMVNSTLNVIITKKIYELFVDNKISNCEMININNFEIAVHNINLLN